MVRSHLYEHEILFPVQPKPGTGPGKELRTRVLSLDDKAEERNCGSLLIRKIILHRYRPTGYLGGFYRLGQTSGWNDFANKEGQQ